MSIYLIGISTYISEKKRLGRRCIMGDYVKPWQENGSKSSLALEPSLGNMRGFDLTGYYKLYAVRKSIRVVYRIVENEVVVEVVGIGKREDFEVYADVARRLLRKE